MTTKLLLLIGAMLAALYLFIRPKNATVVTSGKPLYPSQQANNSAIVTGASSVLAALIGSQPSFLGTPHTSAILTNSELMSEEQYMPTAANANLIAGEPDSSSLAAPNLSQLGYTSMPPDLFSGSSPEMPILNLANDSTLDCPGC